MYKYSEASVIVRECASAGAVTRGDTSLILHNTYIARHHHLSTGCKQSKLT